MFCEPQKLGEICTFVRGPFGGSLKKSCFKPKGYAVYEQQHAIHNQFNNIRYFVDQSKFDEMQRFELKPDDLIMSCSGTMGKVAIAPKGLKKGIINQALLKLSTSEKLDVAYLKNWMESPNFQEQLAGRTKGVAIKNVASVKVLKEITIPLPPLTEQKRIVAILDKAFAAIDKAIANTEKSLANARELFESYLNDVFAEPGDGWEEHQLNNITTKIGSGATPKGGKKAYKTEGISLIRSLNVHDHFFKEKNLAFIDEDQAQKLSNVIIEERDVLLNITGASIARCCVVPESYLPARVNQHVSIIRPVFDLVNSMFLSRLLASKQYKDQLLGIGDKAGSTRQALTKIQLQNFKVTIPSVERQIELNELIDEVWLNSKKLESIYQQKLTNLQDLKQSILQKAFAGELTASSLADIVPEQMEN